MTVVVGFHCSDGVVVAADSMLTSNLGGVDVAHHKGRKLFTLEGGRTSPTRATRVSARGSVPKLRLWTRPSRIHIARLIIRSSCLER